jgi:hypothetical protein
VFPVPLLFAVGKWSRMDNKHSAVVVEKVNDLQQPPAPPTPANQPTFIGAPLRIRTAGTSYHSLGFVRINAMFANMFNVPIDPAEVEIGLAHD